MRYILFGSVSVFYLLSVYAVPMIWTRVYAAIAARFDLSPEQIPLIPISFNLSAGLFAIPSLIYLLRRSKGGLRTPTRLVLAGTCVAAGVLLLWGAFRWFVHNPVEIAAGVTELTEHSKPESPKLQGGVYQDETLGFAVTLPTDWNVLSSNAISRAHVAGVNEISRSGPIAVSSQLPEGVQQFLVLKKYAETHPTFNPSIALASYEKGAMAKQGCTSLSSLFDPLASTGPPFRVLYGPSVSQVGEFQGREVFLRGKVYGKNVSMNIYGFETDSHFITVTLAYESDDDMKSLQAALSSIARRQ